LKGLVNEKKLGDELLYDRQLKIKIIVISVN